MGTFLYSCLHFLVDFLCAHAMFRWAAEGLLPDALVYNFCAFALQMPLGALMDLHSQRQSKLPAAVAALGSALTILGSITCPAVLGLGNALFHVGGGIGVIREDDARHWQGRGLGVFVAPGALGLFLGGQLFEVDIILFLLICAVVLLVPLFRQKTFDATASKSSNGFGFPLLCCFLVVIIRSYVGLSVVFSWKNGFLMGFAAVLAVVLGKMAGGFLASWFGVRKTAAASLILAAVCYGFGNNPLPGLFALFLFNMTMPITLYQIVRRHPQYPGFCFGLLTFGLFLGFLPVYLGWNLPVDGVTGSLLSLALLWPVLRRNET